MLMQLSFILLAQWRQDTFRVPAAYEPVRPDPNPEQQVRAEPPFKRNHQLTRPGGRANMRADRPVIDIAEVRG